MKKFRFPLRSVATLRSLRELKAREQFSEAVHAFVTAEEFLQMVRERVAALENVLRSGRAQTFRAGDEASFLEAYRVETSAAARAAAEVEKARAAMETARQAWLGTRRDVKVVENLETKAKAAHRREVDREDQAALDDRTSAIAARAAAQDL
ncbi:MAG: flagellar FliJ family protein [Nibricoccus sp.]